MAKLRYAHFPGCAAKGSSKELYHATMLITRHLGIELTELTAAACCGAGVIKESNPMLQLAINARTFAMAEAEGLDIMTPCATCQGNMWEDLARLNTDETLRASINVELQRTSGLTYNGGVRMRHLIQVLVEDIGVDTLRSMVKNPLDFPIAGYYGAPMLQPGAISDDDPNDPRYFEDLIDALGGEPVDYEGRMRSVGFPSLLSQPETVLRMTADVLSDAKSEGARIMASACPLSHINLDVYQVKASRLTGKDTQMPVVHLAELVSFALGLENTAWAQLRTRVLTIME